MFLSPLVTVSSALLMITTHGDQSGYLQCSVIHCVGDYQRLVPIKKYNQFSLALGCF